MSLFNRRHVRLHRDRAANIGAENFLLTEVTQSIINRLQDVKKAFNRALIVGYEGGTLKHWLQQSGKCRESVQSDISEQLLRSRRQRDAENLNLLVFDEEHIPFAPHSFDLIIAPLTLHMINDLPGTLIQLKMCLQPEGYFLGSLIGGSSLKSLRQAFIQAEQELEGGVSPRLHPMVDVPTAADLMLRAGYQLPVVDRDIIDVTYDSPLALLKDLRAMGETNALQKRRQTLTRPQTLLRAMEILSQTSEGQRVDSKFSVSFDLIYLTGWGQG